MESFSEEDVRSLAQNLLWYKTSPLHEAIGLQESATYLRSRVSS